MIYFLSFFLFLRLLYCQIWVLFCWYSRFDFNLVFCFCYMYFMFFLLLFYVALVWFQLFIVVLVIPGEKKSLSIHWLVMYIITSVWTLIINPFSHWFLAFHISLFEDKICIWNELGFNLEYINCVNKFNQAELEEFKLFSSQA